MLAPCRGDPEIFEPNTGLKDGEQIPSAYHASPTFPGGYRDSGSIGGYTPLFFRRPEICDGDLPQLPAEPVFEQQGIS